MMRKVHILGVEEVQLHHDHQAASNFEDGLISDRVCVLAKPLGEHEGRSPHVAAGACDVSHQMKI